MRQRERNHNVGLTVDWAVAVRPQELLRKQTATHFSRARAAAWLGKFQDDADLQRAMIRPALTKLAPDTCEHSNKVLDGHLFAAIINFYVRTIHIGARLACTRRALSAECCITSSAETWAGRMLRALQGMSSASMRIMLESGIPSFFIPWYTPSVLPTCR